MNKRKKYNLERAIHNLSENYNRKIKYELEQLEDKKYLITLNIKGKEKQTILFEEDFMSIGRLYSIFTSIM